MEKVFVIVEVVLKTLQNETRTPHFWQTNTKVCANKEVMEREYEALKKKILTTTTFKEMAEAVLNNAPIGDDCDVEWDESDKGFYIAKIDGSVIRRIIIEETNIIK